MGRRIAALSALLALLLCAAAGDSQERKEWSRLVWKNHIKYWNFNGTPRNTVIFYGGFRASGNDLLFAQTDGDHEPELQALAGEEFFVSKPVRLGTRYVLEYWHWTDEGTDSFKGGAISRSYGEEDSPLVIDIPYEPGFYYFGYYDGRPSISKGKLVEWDRFSSEEMRPAALRKALKCYAGTEWAPLLKEELKSAEAEAKRIKAGRRAEKKRKSP